MFDFETSGLEPHFSAIVGLGVYLPESHRCFYMNCGHHIHDVRFPRITEHALANALGSFCESKRTQAVFHNAHYDLQFLHRLGVNVNCRVSCTLVHTHRLDENLRSIGSEPTYHPHLNDVTYSLKNLTVIYFREQPPRLVDATDASNAMFAEIEPVSRYCALDLLNTYNLYDRTRRQLSADPILDNLITDIDDPNNVVIAQMIWNGIQVDVDEAMNQLASYRVAIDSCRDEIWQLVDVDWALDTPQDAIRLLRHLRVPEVLKFDPFVVPGVTSNAGSVARDVLLMIFDSVGDDLIRKVIALLLSKAAMEQRCSSFLIPLPEKVRSSNGRLYPSRFSSTLTTTRFSSSPNLQNLPGKADKYDPTGDDEWRSLLPASCSENHRTRNIFVAAPGCHLVSMDLSAAEPRYLALLFQRALRDRGQEYSRKKMELRHRRRTLYPTLVAEMMRLQKPYTGSPTQIEWPEYTEDPLWRVFRYGDPVDDPYNALLMAIDSNGYRTAKETNSVDAWCRDNRWRGKKAFLALAYGSQASTLAPQLKWSVSRTEAAIQEMESVYATLNPLRQLTFQEMIHLGEVCSLWGRPRRINGYHQLAGVAPVVVQFYRLKPFRQTYQARIIPLGSTRQGVQAFVEECVVVDQSGHRGHVVLAANNRGKITHIDSMDPFIRADHFNQVPFRNINFSQVDWVHDLDDLTRTLPRQNRASRQAFNALCQSTGADHLRWIMDNVDQEIQPNPHWNECRLVLTVHDSLVYEVPDRLVDHFITMAAPIVGRRPHWSDIDMKVSVEIGKRFGDMTEVMVPHPEDPSQKSGAGYARTGKDRRGCMGWVANNQLFSHIVRKMMKGGCER